MRPTTLIAPLILAGCLAVATAQEVSAPPPGDPVSEALTIEAAEAGLEAIESGDSDELTRKTLGDRYREAVDSLKQAAQFRALDQEYRQALETGPDETVKLRAELDGMNGDEASALPDSLNEQSSNEELEDALSREMGELSLLKTEFQDLEDALLAIRNRPIEMRERLIAAQAELKTTTGSQETIRAGISGDASPSQKADLARLQARQQKLEAEISMIEQEDASDEIRIALAEVSRDLTAARIQAGEARVAAIRALASTRLNQQARQAEALVERIQRDVPNAPKFLETLEQELIGRTGEMRIVGEGIRSLETQQRKSDVERQRIAEALAGLKRQISIGGLEGTLAQLLLEQLRLLPSKQEGRQRIEETRATIAEARRGFYDLERSILAKDRAAESDPTAARPELVQYRAEIDALEEAHRNLTADLKAGYRRWIRELGSLELTERQIVEEAQEFRDFTTGKLFWVRSSRPISAGQLGDVPAGLAYCYGLERIGEFGRLLGALSPWFYVVVGAAFLALIGFRRHFGRWLRASGVRTRRISTDRYSHTLLAFLMTFLLAAPAPLVCASLGWILVQQPDASDWSFGLGRAFLEAAWFLLQVGFLIVLCRKDGLGEIHFRWERGTLARVRRLALLLIPIFLPLMFTLVLVLTESDVSFLNGLGRLTAVVMVIGQGGIMALMMHPAKGVAAWVHENAPHSLFGRLRHFWLYLILAMIGFLVVLLLAGYVYTGVLLVRQAAASASAVLAAFVVYGMVLRWFAIRERKLALEEALAKRQARQEAAREEVVALEEMAEAGTDDSLIPEIQEEEQLDLSEVGLQTRNLISFLVSVGLLVALWFIWTEFAPVLEVLDKLKAFGSISVGDLAFTVLVIMVMVETTRNLPGLLEVVVLRRLDLDAGSRNAITTLAKYLVIATGLMFLFNGIGVDWSQFGWIAAALGVGIGFGLQEVVANFICGIILLFERPIRVGDVVTVDGVDGVVSRIQIRATTITNWDRKELIIPNKNFITGTVLNWTLSNALNRIVIVVGAAYGSDTEKARQILLDVAKNHPRIMEEPPPLATFEAFDDSSLRLLLRCYIPDMDGRIVTITELHTEIDKRFKEAGIEIAFPQRDLHLRSADPGISLGTSEKS